MNISMIRHISTAAATALCLLAGSAANASTPAPYIWSEILVPSIGPLAAAFGISDDGTVAVSGASTSGTYRNGIFTALRAAAAGTTATALGANAAGVIVGGATSAANPHEQGFILVGSTYRYFSLPGWDNTEARAISNSGLVTGYSYNDAGGYAGFVYDPAAGTFTDVTPPGSTFTIAQGISKSGRVVGNGQSGAPLGRYAFTSQAVTNVKPSGDRVNFLGRYTVGGGRTNARGINDDGVTSGFAVVDGLQVGYIGNDTRGYRTLVPPGGGVAGFTVACEGINNARQVVCSVLDTTLGVTRAFIGSPQRDDN